MATTRLWSSILVVAIALLAGTLLQIRPVAAQTSQTSVLAVNASGYTYSDGEWSLWAPTGIYVYPGDQLTFSVDSATWCSGGIYNGGASCGGANGIRPASSSERPLTLPGAQIGKLIARISDDGGFSGRDFSVGGGQQTITASYTGYLYLGMNDVTGAYGDNSGAVGVAVVDNPDCGTFQTIQLCSFTPVPTPP